MLIRLPVVLLVWVVAGCTVPVSTTTRPSDYYSSVPQTDSEAGGSLFAGDGSGLSDEAITRALAHRYTVPALSRVALMPFGREVWSAWSEELAVASQTVKSEVVNALLLSPQVYDVSYLPGMLVPERKTVPHLRQAAARYQADLLLIYRSVCRNFERYRVFAADASRAHCAIEAVLLDTRTGLVPFTSVVMETFEARRSEADINFRETMLKAQLESQARALATVADELKTFLANNSSRPGSNF